MSTSACQNKKRRSTVCVSALATAKGAGSHSGPRCRRERPTNPRNLSLLRCHMPSGRKSALCASLGADLVLDYHSQKPWWEGLADEINGGCAIPDTVKETSAHNASTDSQQPFDAVLVATESEIKHVSSAGLLAPDGVLCSIVEPPTSAGLRSLLAESKCVCVRVTCDM